MYFKITPEKFDKIVADNEFLFKTATKFNIDNNQLKTEVKFLNNQVAELKAQKGYQMEHYYLYFGAVILVSLVIGWMMGKAQGRKKASQELEAKEAASQMKKMFENMIGGAR